MVLFSLSFIGILFLPTTIFNTRSNFALWEKYNLASRWTSPERIESVRRIPCVNRNLCKFLLLQKTITAFSAVRRVRGALLPHQPLISPRLVDSWLMPHCMLLLFSRGIIWIFDKKGLLLSEMDWWRRKFTIVFAYLSFVAGYIDEFRASHVLLNIIGGH